MPKLHQTSVESYLLAIRRQLKGLDPAEQRGILRELENHLEDMIRYLRESGLSKEASTERAVAEMGDPIKVGRQLREEHLAKGSPWRYSLLAALPLLIPALGLEVLWIASPLFVNVRATTWLSLLVMLVAFGPILGLCFWACRRRRWVWLAPSAGIILDHIIKQVWVFLAGPWRASGLPELISPWLPTTISAGPDLAQDSWLLLGDWLILALLSPLLLALFLRWGRLPASLVLLGWVGNLVVFQWFEGPLSPYKLLVLLFPFVGLASVAALPCAKRNVTAWAILLGDWLLVALGQWYFLLYEAPHHMNALWRQSHPPTFSTVWGLMPHAALAFSLALLLGVQLLSRLGISCHLKISVR